MKVRLFGGQIANGVGLPDDWPKNGNCLDLSAHEWATWKRGSFSVGIGWRGRAYIELRPPKGFVPSVNEWRDDEWPERPLVSKTIRKLSQEFPDVHFGGTDHPEITVKIRGVQADAIAQTRDTEGRTLSIVQAEAFGVKEAREIAASFQQRVIAAREATQ